MKALNTVGRILNFSVTAMTGILCCVDVPDVERRRTPVRKAWRSHDGIPKQKRKETGGIMKLRGGHKLRHASMALLLGLLVGGVATPAQADPSAKVNLDPIPNRVMTWNTNGQGYGSTELIVDQVRRFRPQIIAFQESCMEEVDRARVRLARDYGLEYNFREGLKTDLLWTNCGYGLGTAVLVAKGLPIRAHNRKGYSQDEGFRESRGMQSFTTRIDGQWVRVFNTHLSTSGRPGLRRLQIRELTNATQPHPRAMILGDFNTRPWDERMNPIWTANFKDVDPFCTKDKDETRCNSTLWKVNAKYDYILHRGLNSRHCRLHTRTDDHRIVISDVTGGPGSSAPCTVTGRPSPP
ncbi:endonuclease/exonuclease/phosphatase family protein [Streptomyces sp. NPDC020412]|uniref:endonuclease/exonuclease/phosphatase family protein n=1 Tax=Streptomyces sp. NPDC020412 TaxID=3365073 RepID=UPI0037B74A55